MRIAKVLGVLIVVAALVVGGILAVKRKKEELKRLPVPKKPRVAVEVAPVKKSCVELTEHYTGKVVPVEQAVISTKIAGFIEYLPKSEGDRVKKGEVIVKIDASQIKSKIDSIKSQILAAEEEVAVKKKTFERNEFLFKHQVISEEAFDNSKLAYQVAEAKLKSLKAELAGLIDELSYAEIRAPFSGVITKRFKQAGDFVAPGMPIIQLENPSKGYKVLVNIPEEKLPDIASQRKAYLTFQGKKLSVKVRKIYPAVAQSGLAQVELFSRRSPFNLPSGSLIGVDLVVKRACGFVLPLDSLVTGKRKGVFVVEEGKLRFVPLKVLGTSKDWFVAKGNLRAGEKVVIGDPGLLLNLYSGEPVVVYANLGSK